MCQLEFKSGPTAPGDQIRRIRDLRPSLRATFRGLIQNVLHCHRDPWSSALARSEGNISDLLQKLQATFKDQISSHVSVAVAAELNKFLEQPLASLNQNSWELDLGPQGNGLVSKDSMPQDVHPVRKDALRTKAFHLGKAL